MLLRVGEMRQTAPEKYSRTLSHVTRHGEQPEVLATPADALSYEILRAWVMVQTATLGLKHGIRYRTVFCARLVFSTRWCRINLT